ncbi:D-psicose/D-tagatose/L-ribulose 3-epimerase [Microbacterium trichothecenolyticum]|uniref:sugar phosphate isomerase/epimerase family protein n=1 Tax=Microbacterium trichothecenolyticum TaxID=69370 RepID=UPI0028608D6C|nr:sugar phosphate isomerase/epimerase [Microbacterium trichothecenolyticum]MDR7184591.1 D-psicose/D-tagatose/L-ribulose 3-epimerase [Microbacterium trichothecenolyticum]
MSQFGCHGSVWSGSFDPESFRSAVRHTVDAGYDLIEIPLLDPYSFDAADGRKVIDEHGIAINASLGLGPATDISSEDPEAIAAGEHLLNRAVDVLAELGAGWLVGVVYGALTKHMAPATERARQNGMDVIRRVSDRAERHGIRVGLEVVNRYETNIMNTAREAIRYVEELDHSNAYIHLDTYHMNIEESDMMNPFLDAGDRLGYVHIGESHRGYLGSGSVDFDTAFRALSRIGYDGPIVFESFSSAVVDPVLSNMLGVWRNLWDDNVDLARHANAFMRDKARAVETIALH